MPLRPGRSKATVQSNIRELHHGPQFAKTAAKHGTETARKQAVAIALETARKSGKKH